MILEKLNSVMTSDSIPWVEKSMISYSQISLFNKCQHAWKLHYIDKIKIPSLSIHMIFGTAMHRVIQTYLTTLYQQSVIEADKINLPELLYKVFAEEYQAERIKNNNINFSTQDEMEEFYNDGIDIIKDFKLDRKNTFNTKSMKLIGIEMPLYIPLDCNENVYLLSYLDVVMYNEADDIIKIYDIKTSTKGWSKYQKNDVSKTNQLLIYKKYFGKLYDIPMANIDIEYYIVKRRLYENAEFEQKRIQKYSPANGSISMKKMTEYISTFVNHAFDQSGNYKLDVEYKKNLGTNNCKFCEYKGTANCPESANI